MTIEQLIKDSHELEKVASKIQAGNRTGIPKEKISDFIDAYRSWYRKCLGVLPDPLKKKFRSEYEGNWFSSKIKAFLEEPNTRETQNSYSYDVKNGVIKSVLQGTYRDWKYSYETTFLQPFLSQRRILVEANLHYVNPDATSEAIEIIERLARQFHLVARQLQQRHNNRTTITISDEYDVQDLFHAMLIPFFEDIRPEEVTPSYAGGHSRIDFLIKSEKTVIEVKMTRSGLKAKDIRDQLLIDFGCYRSHPDCKSFVAFVYDPGRHINNPRGLERDLNRLSDEIHVKVIIAPN